MNHKWVLWQAFILFMLILPALPSISQGVILEENFENSSGLPAGWEEVTTSSFPQWSFSEIGNTHYLVIPYHTKIAYLNEGDSDKEWPGEYLITPAINLSGYTNAYLSVDVFFKAMTYQSNTESFGIEVSVDGGNSWFALRYFSEYFNWHKVYCDLSEYCGNPNVQIAFKYSDGGGWLYGAGLDNVKVQVPYQNDAALLYIEKYNFVLLHDTIRFKGLIQNLGANDLTAVKLNWRVNGGSVCSQDITSMSLSPLDTASFLHSTPWVPSTQESFNIDMWVTDPNGLSDDNPLNDTLSMHITNAVSSKPEKNVFLEVFGASWCTICPHAASMIAEINDSTDNLIVAVIHVEDSYTCSIGTEIFDNYHLFPGWLVTGLIDRYDLYGEVSMDMDRYLWPYFVCHREEKISPVDISAGNTFNPYTRELEIDLFATFRCDLMGDFRFNCYLVEDSIVSGQDNVLTIPDREPYCYKEQWIYNPPGTIENYLHMNVLRDVLGGAWGSFGSLPNYVVDGQEYEFHYNYTVPDSINANNMRIIGLVQKFNTDSSKCEIYNAIDMHLNDLTQIYQADENIRSMIVYPNPARDKIYIKNIDKATDALIFTMQGEMLTTKKIIDNQIDISTFMKGVYILKLSDEKGVNIIKFVKQ
ncbi:MAG: Omp28-related outer membrane protein [Bacteroidota bacterium]